MKNSLLLSIVIMMMAACGQSGTKKFISADNRNIALIGRFDLTDKTSPVFMYSGSVILIFTSAGLRSELHSMDATILFLSTSDTTEKETGPK
jgi:hypothetical protein